MSGGLPVVGQDTQLSPRWGVTKHTHSLVEGY